MKRFFTLLLIFASNIKLNAQSISPAVSVAQCPKVNITFTVSIPISFYKILPGSISVSGVSISINTNSDGFVYSTVAPIAGPVSTTYSGTNSSTQFTFVGQFQDNSTPQTFQVQASDGTSTIYTYDFTFITIKSFYPPITQFLDQQDIPNFLQYVNDETVALSTPSTQPFTSFDAPLCTSVTKTIYFPAVTMFGNNPVTNCCYTPIQVNFSAIPNYQYLIPAGWKLTSSSGTAVSDGSTWLTSSNSVSITSDLTHGHGLSIEIRPINPCGATLATGLVTIIPVNRPAPPTLTITTPTNINELCSGSKTFTVTGASANATYSWSVSPTSLATIPANSISSSVTLTRVGTASGIVTLTAYATDCETLSQPVKISVGAPQGEVVNSVSNMTNCQNGNFVVLPSAPGSPTTYSGTVNMTDAAGLADNFKWSLTGTQENGFAWIDLGGGSVSVLSKVSKPGILPLTFVVSNTCGPYTGYYYFATTNCNAVVQSTNHLFYSGISTEESSDSNLLTGQHINIYPNPAKSMITVYLPENVEINNAFIQISDTYGRKIKKISTPSHSNNIMIQELTTGIYFIEVFNNQKLLIVKKLLIN